MKLDSRKVRSNKFKWKRINSVKVFKHFVSLAKKVVNSQWNHLYQVRPPASYQACQCSVREKERIIPSTTIGEILWPVLNRRSCLQRAMINSPSRSMNLCWQVFQVSIYCFTEYVKGNPRRWDVKLVAAVSISQKLLAFENIHLNTNCDRLQCHLGTPRLLKPQNLCDSIKSLNPVSEKEVEIGHRPIQIQSFVPHHPNEFWTLSITQPGFTSGRIQ